MQAVGYVVGAIAIVGTLSAVASTMRPVSNTPPQAVVTKPELAPKPAAPVIEDQAVHPLGPISPAAVDAVKPKPPALASSEPDDPDLTGIETVGRSLATDRAESRAHMPKLKRGKGGLKARKALRKRTSKKKHAAR